MKKVSVLALVAAVAMLAVSCKNQPKEAEVVEPVQEEVVVAEPVEAVEEAAEAVEAAAEAVEVAAEEIAK